MIATCPRCGRRTVASAGAREILCVCGNRFDPAARPTLKDPFLGQVVAGCIVKERIGTGGMGTLYRALQMSLNRPVALKVLPAEASDDPQFVRRFEREAEVLASLAHPSIVSVIDRGKWKGRYFILMEYVGGESLRDRLREGPLPDQEARSIMDQLLAALDYTHTQGVIHRDIKPENILLSRDGGVKVADFGLARMLGGEDERSRLAGSRLVVGTYEYMAPEQREPGYSSGPAADLYAAAVVYYEMLTGELPAGRFDLPAGKTGAFFERALAKDPKRRYESAAAMRKALAGPPSETPRPPSAFDLRLDLLSTLLAVCGMLAVVAGIVLLVRSAPLRLGLVHLSPDVAGVTVIVFGLLLWNAAERARRFRPGARAMLLVLTASSVPLLYPLPLVVWVWGTLLSRSTRIYYDARFRGLDSAEAALAAQGLPLPDHPRASVSRRLRAAAAANCVLSLFLGGCAAALLLAWGIGYLAGGVSGGRALPLVAVALAAVALFLAGLGRRVARGRALATNAWIWTVLGLLRPSAGARARMLLRDSRDGLV